LLLGFAALDPIVAPERPVVEPWAYFLTIACYGERLHGDSRGSVDRDHNAPSGRYVPEDPSRARVEQRMMVEEKAWLTHQERATVLAEICRVGAFREWQLHAAHVRSTHLHMVVTTSLPPEKVVGEIKSYTSRALNQAFGYKRKRWVRHGSTVWLWDHARFRNAVEYVVFEQGKPMALYVNPILWPEYIETEP
jgi:REP element-mobilizing transposase RayT